MTDSQSGRANEDTKRRRLNPPAPLSKTDPVIFGPTSVFAHMLSFFPAHCLNLRMVGEHLNSHTHSEFVCAHTQTNYHQVSSVWCDAVLVALHTLHPEELLVSVVRRKQGCWTIPLCTVNSIMVYDNLKGLHIGNLALSLF
jgi:hypothetical protein